MKNKTFTVTTTQLNTHNIVEVDTELDLTITSPIANTDTRKYFPKKIRFINTTGVTITANIMSSSDEYSDYLLDSTNYDFFSIFNNTSESFTTPGIIPSAYKILVLCPSGTASTNLSIECIGYQPRGLS